MEILKAPNLACLMKNSHGPNSRRWTYRKSWSLVTAAIVEGVAIEDDPPTATRVNLTGSTHRGTWRNCRSRRRVPRREN